MADFTWDDMPEEMAGLLYEACVGTPLVVEERLGQLVDWVCNNVETCAARQEKWTSLPEARCSELPVPGSEFCPLHMPPGDLDG